MFMCNCKYPAKISLLSSKQIRSPDYLCAIDDIKESVSDRFFLWIEFILDSWCAVTLWPITNWINDRIDVGLLFWWNSRFGISCYQFILAILLHKCLNDHSHFISYLFMLTYITRYVFWFCWFWLFSFVTQTFLHILNYRQFIV